MYYIYLYIVCLSSQIIIIIYLYKFAVKTLKVVQQFTYFLTMTYLNIVHTYVMCVHCNDVCVSLLFMCMLTNAQTLI